MLHIDGDHAYEAVRADIAKYLPRLRKGGVDIFDDYDSAHPDVTRAVHHLLAEDGGCRVMAVNNGTPDGHEYGASACGGIRSFPGRVKHLS